MKMIINRILTYFKERYNMDKKEMILKQAVDTYHAVLETNKKREDSEELTEIPEITDEIMRELFEDYFYGGGKLHEATSRLFEKFDKIVPDAEINWEDKNYQETQEYKQHYYHYHARSVLSDIRRRMNAEVIWIQINGKMHTPEESAKIAADKVCELCFGWHLQDNGALNEEPSFKASLLATCMGDDIKNKIPEENKKKAYELFYEYFLRYIKYVNDPYNNYYAEWLRTTLPSCDPSRFNWEYPDGELYCDYGPNWAWSTILETAGIDSNKASLICPWKTGISIRIADNAVVYQTYGKTEYL